MRSRWASEEGGDLRPCPRGAEITSPSSARCPATTNSRGGPLCTACTALLANGMRAATRNIDGTDVSSGERGSGSAGSKRKFRGGSGPSQGWCAWEKGDPLFPSVRSFTRRGRKKVSLGRALARDEGGHSARGREPQGQGQNRKKKSTDRVLLADNVLSREKKKEKRCLQGIGGRESQKRARLGSAICPLAPAAAGA